MKRAFSDLTIAPTNLTDPQTPLTRVEQDTDESPQKRIALTRDSPCEPFTRTRRKPEIAADVFNHVVSFLRLTEEEAWEWRGLTKKLHRDFFARTRYTNQKRMFKLAAMKYSFKNLTSIYPLDRNTPPAALAAITAEQFPRLASMNLEDISKEKLKHFTGHSGVKTILGAKGGSFMAEHKFPSLLYVNFSGRPPAPHSKICFLEWSVRSEVKPKHISSITKERYPKLQTVNVWAKWTLDRSGFTKMAAALRPQRVHVKIEAVNG